MSTPARGQHGNRAGDAPPARRVVADEACQCERPAIEAGSVGITKAGRAPPAGRSLLNITVGLHAAYSFAILGALASPSFGRQPLRCRWSGKPILCCSDDLFPWRRFTSVVACHGSMVASP